MRNTLSRLVAGSVRHSFTPTRLGYLVQSDRELMDLRAGLIPRWARRVVPIHEAGGKHYLDPSPWALVQGLNGIDSARLLTEHRSEIARSGFFAPPRADRLRRLEILFGENQCRGHARSRLMDRLVLRVESLPHGNKPYRSWSYLGEDFDAVWREVPLLRVRLKPEQSCAFKILFTLFTIWQNDSAVPELPSCC